MTQAKQMEKLTQARLKELLNYDPETGIFTRKIKTARNTIAGSIAGGLAKSGYVQIGLDYKRYLAHRLAFLFMEGELPGKGLQVDHIDHVRDNNIWKNLRIVTKQDNGRNRSMGKANTSGVVGVYLRNRDGKWKAQICINEKVEYLGSFDNKNDATKARKAAERKYGFHPNHGSKSKYS